MSPNEQAMKPTTSPNSKIKARDKEREKRVKMVPKQQTERLKTVVRRLPPNLPEDIFWQSVQQWVTAETATWKSYHQGKFRKRLNKENIPSRAYIVFKDEELLANFSREYDGHLFRDKAGNESVAVVEFAPFQKVPSEKKKADGRMGTIEKDEDYVSFLASLQDGSAKQSDIDNYDQLLAASQPPPQPTTTPLLEALKAEKSALKDKEAILRNHAHYKDHNPAQSASAKKDDAKKKSAATPGPATATKHAEAQGNKKSTKKPAAVGKAAHQHQPQQSASSNAPAHGVATGAQPKVQSTPATPPKAPRPPRERHPKPPVPLAAPTGPSAPTAHSSEGVSTAQTDSSAAAPPAATRRVRPMLGLGSRQFEAALSGAGMPVSSGERRPRREREKEKAKEKESNDIVSATPTGAADTHVKGPSRPREERRGASSAPSSQRVPSNRAAPPAPLIMQRDGQPTPPKILGTSAGGESVHGHEEATSPRSGGRPRGRGRGRGGARGGG
ncbi:uncharacterized protein FIBRA_07844 [Fibroporia radiculosa]|uniref:UPF3 domain-containing protein n=1 Tax=Fibroporia radiculosa TaxID=599839 RepID=J4GVQ3_9APHY|nr:uncharacterized protein FIBRA_07844 [Fibroporia radiculosa]CCM05615.1 predicted protein [Fibroporia radiculosa]